LVFEFRNVIHVLEDEEEAEREDPFVQQTVLLIVDLAIHSPAKDEGLLINFFKWIIFLKYFSFFITLVLLPCELHF